MEVLVEYECPECGTNKWDVNGTEAVCCSCGYIQENIINHIEADTKEALRQLEEIEEWLSTVTTAESTDDLK